MEDEEVRITGKRRKRKFGIDDECECDDMGSNEYIRPVDEKDQKFIDNETTYRSDVYASGSKRSNFKSLSDPSIVTVPEHMADTDATRNKAYDALCLGNFLFTFQRIKTDKGTVNKAEVSLVAFSLVKKDGKSKLKRLKGIKVWLSSLPSETVNSYVDITVFNCNTNRHRSEERKREIQATIIGALCHMYRPATIIKSSPDWMEYDGQRDGEKAIAAMMKRYAGLYISNDQESIMFHAGCFQQHIETSVPVLPVIRLERDIDADNNASQ